MKLVAILTFSCATLTAASSIPVRRQSFLRQNGEDAIALNAQFASLTPNSSCTNDGYACVQNALAQCVSGQFVLQPACATGLVCAAVPLSAVEPGTAILCTTAEDRDESIARTGATGDGTSNATSTTSSTAPPEAGSATSVANPVQTSTASANGTTSGNSTSPDPGTRDPQSSLTLSLEVIATGFEDDGQNQTTNAGQVPSLTSSNNFINFCLTVPQLPLTNGKQINTGSCNPAPMGVLASTTNMPSAKFAFPTNGAVLPANTTFTVRLALAHLDAGHYTNPETTFLAAPQQVNDDGDVRGHSNVVIERLDGFDQTTPTDPTGFAFFKGVDEPAQDGVLSVNVTGGLDVGVYRIASANSAANHQPVLVAVAQHGALDDMVYFSVTDDVDG